MATKEQTSILLLGQDRYAIQACVRLGLDTVVVCGSAAYDYGLAAVPPEVTFLRVDDHNNAESVLAALERAGLGGRHFDGVQTTDEWTLVTASLLSGHFGCAGMDPVTAVHFRDKALQKRRVADAGLDVAAVTVIEDILDVSGIDELPFLKAVLKPIAGAATAHTSVVTSLDDLRKASDVLRRQNPPQRTFILEQFREGDEWCADGVVHNGELLFRAFARYGAPNLTVVANHLPVTVYRMDPDRDAEAYRLGTGVVRSALEALGLRDGVFHMELFHERESGRLTFSECAARRGGAMIHEEMQAKFNVHLGESAVLCALGRRPGLDVKVDSRYFASTYLTTRPGTLIGCPSPAEVKSQPGVEFARIERAFGMRFADSLSSTNQRVGQFLTAAASPVELDRQLGTVRAWFDERLVVVPAGLSERDLRSWQRAAFPAGDFSDTLWD